MTVELDLYTFIMERKAMNLIAIAKANVKSLFYNIQHLQTG